MSKIWPSMPGSKFHLEYVACAEVYAFLCQAAQGLPLNQGKWPYDSWEGSAQQHLVQCDVWQRGLLLQGDLADLLCLCLKFGK